MYFLSKCTIFAKWGQNIVSALLQYTFFKYSKDRTDKENKCPTTKFIVFNPLYMSNYKFLSHVNQKIQKFIYFFNILFSLHPSQKYLDKKLTIINFYKTKVVGLKFLMLLIFSKIVTIYKVSKLTTKLSILQKRDTLYTLLFYM